MTIFKRHSFYAFALVWRIQNAAATTTENDSKELQILSFTGAAAASRVFNEALAKIAVNAQHGGTTDIGKFIYLYYNAFSIESDK